MSTFRNLAFLFLVAVGLLAYQGETNALNLIPTYPVCEDGCTCTVDPWAWNTVYIDCPDVAPVDECPYVWDSCSEYCPYLAAYVGGGASCEMDEEILGCYDPSPAAEPPTNAVCSCICWY